MRKTCGKKRLQVKMRVKCEKKNGSMSVGAKVFVVEINSITFKIRCK